MAPVFVATVALLVTAAAPSPPAFAVPGATITGHVLDYGAPVSGVTVAIARYNVSSSLPGGNAFYATGATSLFDADPINVEVGGSLTIEESRCRPTVG